MALLHTIRRNRSTIFFILFLMLIYRLFFGSAPSSSHSLSTPSTRINAPSISLSPFKTVLSTIDESSIECFVPDNRKERAESNVEITQYLDATIPNRTRYCKIRNICFDGTGLFLVRKVFPDNSGASTEKPAKQGIKDVQVSEKFVDDEKSNSNSTDKQGEGDEEIDDPSLPVHLRQSHPINVVASTPDSDHYFKIPVRNFTPTDTSQLTYHPSTLFMMKSFWSDGFQFYWAHNFLPLFNMILNHSSLTSTSKSLFLLSTDWAGQLESFQSQIDLLNWNEIYRVKRRKSMLFGSEREFVFHTPSSGSGGHSGREKYVDKLVCYREGILGLANACHDYNFCANEISGQVYEELKMFMWRYYWWFSESRIDHDSYGRATSSSSFSFSSDKSTTDSDKSSSKSTNTPQPKWLRLLQIPSTIDSPPTTYSLIQSDMKARGTYHALIFRFPGRKNIQNPHIVTAVLKKHNIPHTFIHVSSLSSFAEYYTLFASHYLIIAPHADILSHGMWMPTGSVMIQLMPYQGFDLWFDRIYIKRQVNKLTVPCDKWKICGEQDELALGPLDRSVHVDEEEFEHAVVEAVGLLDKVREKKF
ncbi:hypothetical protein BKA69DRAFT_1036213 [Paraphysoderma sedebokerense]|nr:hypothetical protein BKA69DRAFT_1036213 [Paraphysoderma sedebokerense]